MCLISPDHFCYVCGLLVKERSTKSKTPLRKMTANLSEAYNTYFGFSVANLNKLWTPSSICGSCETTLSFIYYGKEKYFTFGIPMLWRESTNHTTDCYFCLTKEQRGRIPAVYPNVSSVSKPVAHSESLPRPKLAVAGPSKKRKNSISSDNPLIELKATDPPEVNKHVIIDPDEPTESTVAGPSQKRKNSISSESSLIELEATVPPEEKNHLLSQGELSDLCRDLYLTKSNSEILASRLQQWGYLAPDTRVTYYRKRRKSFTLFFAKSNNYCYCFDIIGLFNALNETYDSSQWRLFIDGGKDSLKAVLLHKSNTKPSIPIGYAKHMKESYDSMKQLLTLINYNQHGWKICADLKIVAILSGLQGGNTKYPCFLCLWDRTTRHNHYSQRVWPERTKHTLGEYNIKNAPLIAQDMIILPPLHIKLGLFTNFVKTLVKNNVTIGIDYLKIQFPRLTTSKIEAGIFDGPQIRKLINDTKFNECLSGAYLEAWEAFKDVVQNFLGNNKSPNYVEIVNTLLQKYNKIGIHESKYYI